MATGNKHRKFGAVQLHGFRVMRADRQTNKQGQSNNPTIISSAGLMLMKAIATDVTCSMVCMPAGHDHENWLNLLSWRK